jgi:hypothetical protein
MKSPVPLYQIYQSAMKAKQPLNSQPILSGRPFARVRPPVRTRMGWNYNDYIAVTTRQAATRNLFDQSPQHQLVVTMGIFASRLGIKRVTLHVPTVADMSPSVPDRPGTGKVGIVSFKLIETKKLAP